MNLKELSLSDLKVLAETLESKYYECWKVVLDDQKPEVDQELRDKIEAKHSEVILEVNTRIENFINQ
jgi:hypothetical protein